MGVPLVRGRFFGAPDRSDDVLKKVIVNQTMADMFSPGMDPVGRTISMDWGSPLRGQIVGVVKDVKLVALEDMPRPQIYWFMPQFQMEFMSLVTRTAGDPKTLAKAARAQIYAIDPDLPVANIRTMNEVMGTSVKQPRFTMLLLGSFAGVALLLAAVGIYGVISCSVTQRRHELGVRMALGARSADVLRLVVLEGMGVTLSGMAVGLVIAFAAARFLASLLFAVKATDFSIFGGVVVLLGGVALMAAYIPARRAAKLDPLVALRYE
jgi:putative ABC transport system permease protein